MTILVAAHDPGGAAALAPVVPALAARGVECRIAATGPAAGTFLAAGLGVDATTVSEAEVEGADVLLAGTSFSSTFERDLLAAAHESSIPSLALVDSWTNHDRRFGKTWPDVVAAPDPLAALDILASGVPASRITVTGQPALDVFARRAAMPSVRTQVRESLGVRDDEALAVFFSQPIAALYGRSRGYDERDALALLREALPDGVRVLVKAHPKEAASVGDSEAAGLDADDLVIASDIVTGMTSIALVKGAIAGRQVVSLQPSLAGADALVLARLGLVETARDLAGAKRALAAPSPVPPREWTDGGSVERLVSLILRMREGERAPHLEMTRGRVRLTALREADARGPYPDWLNDPKVTEGTSHGASPYSEADALAFIRRSRIVADEIVLAIRLAADGRHVGNLSLKKISPRSASCELAILLGDRDVWGTGVAFEACQAALSYAFTKFGLHRAYCGTFETNEGMQRLALRLGMLQEGRRREAAWKDGRFIDILEYGVLRSEYEARFAGSAG